MLLLLYLYSVLTIEFFTEVEEMWPASRVRVDGSLSMEDTSFTSPKSFYLNCMQRNFVMSYFLIGSKSALADDFLLADLKAS